MSMFEKIKEIIVECTNVSPDLVKPEADLIKEVGFDSLDCVEFIMFLEEEFGVELGDEKIDAVKTVSDVEAYIRSAVADRDMQEVASA